MTINNNKMITIPYQYRVLFYQPLRANAQVIKYLEQNNFSVLCSTDDSIKEDLKFGKYDIAIVDDVQFNDVSITQWFRRFDTTSPLIILASSTNYNNMVQAYDDGADDYAVAPTNLNLLCRKIRAILRRCGIKARVYESSYNIGKYIYDPSLSILRYENTEVDLTPKLNGILKLLCAYKNELLPKELILQDVWRGYDTFFAKRSLDVHITLLRGHLKGDPSIAIKTVRGRGYSLVINDKK